MIYFLRRFKGIAYFLVTLMLFQSCIAYQKTSTVEDALAAETPMKIISKYGDKYKLSWIEKRDENIFSIKNAKRKYFTKNQIAQIAKDDNTAEVISKDSLFKDTGPVQIVTIDKKGRYKSHRFIRLAADDENITGYKMISKDTLTIIIPIDQIEKIQLKDKGKSAGRTVGLGVGVGIGLGFILFLAGGGLDIDMNISTN